MAIDDDGVKAETLHSDSVGLHVVLQGRRIRLAEAVDVDDGAKVVQLVEASEVESFPDVALHGLAVAHQAKGPVTGLVDVLAAVSHASGNAESLTQRSSGAIDETQPGSWMTFQVRVDFPQVHQIFDGKQASLGPSRVQNRSGVALGQYEPVIVDAARLLHIIPFKNKRSVAN